MRALQIIEVAYRGTLEEQDDTIIWLTHAMKGADADLSVLLCGNAVNYILPEQKPPLLEFGNWKQTQPTDIAGDIEKLIARGVEVYAVRDDLRCRGLLDRDYLQNIILIDRDELAQLMEAYDRIWYW